MWTVEVPEVLREAQGHHRSATVSACVKRCSRDDINPQLSCQRKVVAKLRDGWPLCACGQRPRPPSDTEAESVDAEVSADPASDSEPGEFESESEASVASVAPALADLADREGAAGVYDTTHGLVSWTSIRVLWLASQCAYNHSGSLACFALFRHACEHCSPVAYHHGASRGAVCFAGHTLDKALTNIVVDKDMLRHVFVDIERPKILKAERVKTQVLPPPTPSGLPPLPRKIEGKRQLGSAGLGREKRVRNGECWLWVDAQKKDGKISAMWSCVFLRMELAMVGSASEMAEDGVPTGIQSTIPPSGAPWGSALDDPETLMDLMQRDVE
eukprot:s1170_g7.t1